MAQSGKAPLCLIIAGPNGAGKTTFAKEFLPREGGIIHFVNADLIARHGQARCREIAAEQGAKTMRAFRSVDDLPKAMQQAHAQAIADRSNLIGGR